MSFYPSSASSNGLQVPNSALPRNNYATSGQYILPAAAQETAAFDELTLPTDSLYNLQDLEVYNLTGAEATAATTSGYIGRQQISGIAGPDSAQLGMNGAVNHHDAAFGAWPAIPIPVGNGYMPSPYENTAMNDAFSRQLFGNQPEYSQTFAPMPSVGEDLALDPVGENLDSIELRNSELFWEQYDRGDPSYGRDLFPNAIGSAARAMPREYYRLFPADQANKATASSYVSLPDGTHFISELTAKETRDWSFLPNRLVISRDMNEYELEWFREFGADLLHDVLARAYDFPRYAMMDKIRGQPVLANGQKQFDRQSTLEHLQRTISNRRQRHRKENFGGLLMKFRKNVRGQGPLDDFIMPKVLDTRGQNILNSDGTVRRTVLSEEQLFFGTRLDIDIDRIVMIQPNTGREYVLPEPKELSEVVASRLTAHGFRVPTLERLYQDHPRIQAYRETLHPLYERRKEEEQELREDFVEWANVLNSTTLPAPTHTELREVKPNGTKGRKKRPAENDYNMTETDNEQGNTAKKVKSKGSIPRSVPQSTNAPWPQQHIGGHQQLHASPGSHVVQIGQEHVAGGIGWKDAQYEQEQMTYPLPAPPSNFQPIMSSPNVNDVQNRRLPATGHAGLEHDVREYNPRHQSSGNRLASGDSVLDVLSSISSNVNLNAQSLLRPSEARRTSQPQHGALNWERFVPPHLNDITSSHNPDSIESRQVLQRLRDLRDRLVSRLVGTPSSDQPIT